MLGWFPSNTIEGRLELVSKKLASKNFKVQRASVTTLDTKLGIRLSIDKSTVVDIGAVKYTQVNYCYLLYLCSRYNEKQFGEDRQDLSGEHMAEGFAKLNKKLYDTLKRNVSGDKVICVRAKGNIASDWGAPCSLEAVKQSGAVSSIADGGVHMEIATAFADAANKLIIPHYYKQK